MAHPSRNVATKNESTPESVFPIKPKEKAHSSETIAKKNIQLVLDEPMFYEIIVSIKGLPTVGKTKGELISSTRGSRNILKVFIPWFFISSKYL